LTPVPGAAEDLLGVRHLRGRILPVLDGRLRLGLSLSPPVDPATVRIVMLSHASQLVGLRVDAVGELLNSEGAEIAPPPPGRASRREDPVSGVLAWQGCFVALLDVPRLCRLSGETDHVA
jgi:purine-binding chemotaxis protein CheW